MTLGASLFLVAVGAILTFAVNKSVSGFEISTAGIILMVTGGIAGLAWILLEGRNDDDGPDPDSGY